eukprot:COSAG02_NODE_2781_length_8038_cov_3.889533_3_plen_625_part_00
MKAGLLAQEPATVVPHVEAVPVDTGTAAPVSNGGSNDVPVLTSEAPMEVEGRIMHGIELNRPLRDVGWAALFVMAVIAAFGLGTATVSKVNLAATTLHNCQAFTKSTQYTQHTAGGLPPSTSPGDPPDSNTAAADPDMSSLATQTAQLLCFICGLAAAISALFLLGLEKQARAITWVSVTMWPSMLTLVGLKVAQQGDPWGYWFVFCGLLWACVVFARREAVELTSELLRMSATAFKQNLGLILTTALPNIALYILVLSPLCGMIYVCLSPQQAALQLAGCGACDFAQSSGTGTDPYAGPYADPYSDAAYNRNDPSTPTAHSSDPTTWGDLTDKCGEGADPGLPNQAIWVTLLFVCVWAKMLSRDIVACTVGGCIGLHYFETPFGGGSRAVQGLKWSMTSSFGSLCYSSFIMTLVAIIDAFLRRMQEEANSGSNIILKIVMMMVMCLWGYLEAYLKFLNKMAVLSLSITGENFCPSAKKVQTMLWRHNLDGILVDSFGGVALWSFSLIISVAGGFATYAYQSLAHPGDDFSAAILGWLAGFMTFIMLMAIAGIVLLVSDTHYLCYIVDLDHEHAPQPRTEHIHGLYQRAIGNRIRFLRAHPKKWAATGPGKREKSSGTQIAYTF